MKLKKMAALAIGVLTLSVTAVPTQACFLNWEKTCGSHVRDNSTSNHDGKGCKKTIKVYSTYETCTKGKCDSKLDGQHNHSEYHSLCGKHDGKLPSCPEY